MSSEAVESITSKSAHKWKKGLKMALPHVALYSFLFCYLLAGAWAFHWIEYEADAVIQKTKLEKIKKVYKQIAEEIEEIAQNKDVWNKNKLNIFSELSRLSSVHEGRSFYLTPDLSSMDALPARWTKSSSFLYALSILTTTGYSYAVPVTPWGQYCAIAYGLLGIPLMVLAAVDIGRFLSHIVLELYAKYHAMSKRFCNKKGILVNTTAVLRVQGRRAVSRLSIRRRPSIEEEMNAHETSSSQKSDHETATTRLPLSINASILLVFCMMGGVMYIAAGGEATFIEAFFVTFNLVANLTMSEMPNDLNHALTLVYIFVFVTFGVAVLSMCAELAAFELKEIFLKIHYFGRKINFKRKHKKEQMEVEVKELLKIIEEIRRRYPDKEHITTLDILQYMHEAAEMPALAERRDTIAFMPQTMEMLRFADELDMEERSTSRLEEMPLIEKSSRVVDVLLISHDVDLEHKFSNELKKYGKCAKK